LILNIFRVYALVGVGLGREIGSMVSIFLFVLYLYFSFIFTGGGTGEGNNSGRRFRGKVLAVINERNSKTIP
jgi:hypothetical protein